jgi:hypothetical protein
MQLTDQADLRQARDHIVSKNIVLTDAEKKIADPEELFEPTNRRLKDIVVIARIQQILQPR